MNEREKALYELIRRMTDEEFRQLIDLKRKELERAKTPSSSYFSKSA